jgi:hypothetical protein
LCQSFDPALGLGLKPPHGLLLFFNDVQQLLDGEFAVERVRSDLAYIDGQDVGHIVTIAYRERVSERAARLQVWDGPCPIVPFSSV